MRSIPDIGERLTQEEIEERFNTGFGYRISGINLRKDSRGRYILLFSREDGPYGDEIGEKRFRYIGEGQDGDQSEDSPGNRALIEASKGDTPVYFFHKGTEEDGWEYRGEVEITGYSTVRRGGREVLEFEAEYSE